MEGRYDPSRLDRRDPELIRRVLPLFDRVNRSWLRLEVTGTEHIAGGPALFAGNHSGGITGPDLSCTLATLWHALGVEAPLYALAHDLAMAHLPPLGRVLQKLGCVRAQPENAARVLERGGHILVYPGGELEAFRLHRHRHRIMFGERAGFVRVAQRTGARIVPVVAHGAHSSSIIVHEGEWLARVLGLHERRVMRMPIAFGLPWLVGAGPLPYLPLPLPIRLRFLPAVTPEPGEDPAAVRDRIVRAMQAAMDAMVEEAR